MESEWTKEERHQLMDRLLRVCRTHRRACEREIGLIGVHRSQHMLLMHLSGSDKVASQKELAEHFHISPAAVTNHLQKLEKDGYIERVSAAADNRYREIRITETGREVIRRSQAVFSGIDEKMFAGFTRAEAAALSGMLDRLQENLQVGDGEGEHFPQPPVQDGCRRKQE